MVEIPSTFALLSFRAAAHHLSFLQAASDRNVTPGAISRQIQGLEDLLGTRLFYRHHKRVELTVQGRDYLAEITTPLDHLAAATAWIQGAGDSGALSICPIRPLPFAGCCPDGGGFMIATRRLICA